MDIKNSVVESGLDFLGSGSRTHTHTNIYVYTYIYVGGARWRIG